MDGITDLSCKNGITHYRVDGWEATHNRSVAGSSASRPMRWAVDPSGGPPSFRFVGVPPGGP
jgi:hypothetical protein